MPNRRQAITWTIDDPVHWHIYAALGRDELIMLGHAIAWTCHCVSNHQQLKGFFNSLDSPCKEPIIIIMIIILTHDFVSTPSVQQQSFPSCQKPFKLISCLWWPTVNGRPIYLCAEVLTCPPLSQIWHDPGVKACMSAAIWPLNIPQSYQSLQTMYETCYLGSGVHQMNHVI